MSYYRTCPYCGTALDPCERCDCMNPEQTENEQREKATADATNIDGGKGVNGFVRPIHASSVNENKEDCKR